MVKEVRQIVQTIPKCEAERYMFGNILFQRLHKDNLWYAIKNNQIIDWDQYRHDLEERLKEIKDE